MNVYIHLHISKVKSSNSYLPAAENSNHLVGSWCVRAKTGTPRAPPENTNHTAKTGIRTHNPNVLVAQCD